MIKRAVTLIIVMVGWVFFSAPTLSEAMLYLRTMFGGGIGFADAQAKYLLSGNIIVILIGIVAATPLYKRVIRSLRPQTVSRLKIAVFPILFLLCLVFMISETYNPFLYFRFWYGKKRNE